MIEKYTNCKICPRKCSVDRSVTTGFCGEKNSMRVARIAPHYWEEPCLAGENGSGAVFFSGCNLKCVYCQNNVIAHGKGTYISEDALAEKMLILQEMGCDNVNLITATHFIPSVVNTLIMAKKMGLTIPIVYNCGGYESKEGLDLLSGHVDIYLPDMKYSDPKLAEKYSCAPDYPEVCKKALDIMYEQVGKPLFNEKGMMKKGMIVRVLALPGCEANTKEILKYLKKRFGNSIYISLMNQYTPVKGLDGYEELKRKLSDEEYEELCGYAKGLRIKNGFFQESETALESFIPDFNDGGIL